eukprot:GSA25T00018301001.1
MKPGPYGVAEEDEDRWCEHTGECTGCQFSSVRYARQLVEKRSWLLRAFPCGKVSRCLPAIHGHTEFEYSAEWGYGYSVGRGPAGFASDVESSPNMCRRLPKRLFRAMREASETFEDRYAPKIKGICGRGKDGNFEVLLDVRGGSLGYFLDELDVQVFKERNPYVKALTHHRGRVLVFGETKTVRQHVRLEVVAKLMKDRKLPILEH